MVSILIPTYNYDITKLVGLLHKQATDTGIDFEIMICDDASLDQQIKLKNKKTETLPHCFYFENKSNLGRTKTRQYLANKASYNWLLFLDADVLPKKDTFLKKYFIEIQRKSHRNPVIFGGVAYQEHTPDSKKILRWKYGKKSEAKAAVKRIKNPYNVISQNLLIKKEVFLENNVSGNEYGLDILFSYRLKKNNISVLHIENPVVHYGLETASVFFSKSLEAVKTTFIFEEKGLLASDFRPLQKSYLLLQKFHLEKLFILFLSSFVPLIEKNIFSKNPSIFLFNLYRLYFYINLKRNA